MIVRFADELCTNLRNCYATHKHRFETSTLEKGCKQSPLAWREATNWGMNSVPSQVHHKLKRKSIAGHYWPKTWYCLWYVVLGPDMQSKMNFCRLDGRCWLFEISSRVSFLRSPDTMHQWQCQTLVQPLELFGHGNHKMTTVWMRKVLDSQDSKSNIRSRRGEGHHCRGWKLVVPLDSISDSKSNGFS
jgi:hypothetical protein